MPPLPLVALDVIIERVGIPSPWPEPTPAPTPVPTPGPCLMLFFNCNASGAPCISCSSSFIASSPTPAAFLRAASSASPGGFSGIGWRASGTGIFSARTFGVTCLGSTDLVGSGSRLGLIHRGGGQGLGLDTRGRGRGVVLEQQLGQPRRELLGLLAIDLRHRQPPDRQPQQQA